MQYLLYLLKKKLKKNNRTDFLFSLAPDSSILDVGCEKYSYLIFKTILPKCKYTGLDIIRHKPSQEIFKDIFFLEADPKSFSYKISNFFETFDAVVSSHNLEHCNDRQKTLEAMLDSIKVGGKFFLSTPSEASVNFPSRKGTLNYYDDPTHKLTPINFDETIAAIRLRGFKIEYSNKNYSTKILRLIGFFFEPISKATNKTMPGTWEYYGFESIIIAKKIRTLAL